jgi:hypothetical protein
MMQGLVDFRRDVAGGACRDLAKCGELHCTPITISLFPTNLKENLRVFFAGALGGWSLAGGDFSGVMIRSELSTVYPSASVAASARRVCAIERRSHVGLTPQRSPLGDS